MTSFYYLSVCLYFGPSLLSLYKTSVICICRSGIDEGHVNSYLLLFSRLTHLTITRGPKKHLKRLNAPKHWMLNKMGGVWAPHPS
ncbi:hypothetical protein JH06_3011, partial [Blastocystis sp. subtype 4]|uniref:hypothetical protein n=1 Tax=Blastocystis sp. subtype 4 TaxID=944170 RepID=UPI00071189AE